MRPDEAIELIRDAVRGTGSRWADLGAGNGTFTQALVTLLGPSAHIYSVDLDPEAVAAVRDWAKSHAPGVVAIHGDISAPLELPGLNGHSLDGVLLANSLHYVPDGDEALARITARLRPGGRVVFVEYDQRDATRWVPYPVPLERLPALAARAGLSEPVITASKRSRYGGRLYVAVAERASAAIEEA